MIEFKLVGNIPSKKNTWKIGKHGIYQSKQNEINDLLVQLAAQKPVNYPLPIKTQCRLVLIVWGSFKQDLDNQLTCVCDLLQKSGIIKNDNLFVQIKAEKIKDNKNQKAEIKIWELSEQLNYQ